MLGSQWPEQTGQLQMFAECMSACVIELIDEQVLNGIKIKVLAVRF